MVFTSSKRCADFESYPKRCSSWYWTDDYARCQHAGQLYCTLNNVSLNMCSSIHILALLTLTGCSNVYSKQFWKKPLFLHGLVLLISQFCIVNIFIVWIMLKVSYISICLWEFIHNFFINVWIKKKKPWMITVFRIMPEWQHVMVVVPQSTQLFS